MATMNTLNLPLSPTAAEAGGPIVVLNPGRARTLAVRATERLEVLQGRLWLTRRGDLDDHFLHDGEQIVFGRREQVVIESDGPEPARFRIDAPAA
jgi:hypothetical protein